jgi:hypothetical protein
MGEEIEVDDEIEPAKPVDSGRAASFVQPTPDCVEPITRQSPDAFSDRIDDRDRNASIAEDRGQMAAVACQRKDAGGRPRETAIDQVFDKALGMGVQRGGRQRGRRVRIVRLRWAMARKLSQPASAAHAEPQWQPLGWHLAGMRKGSAGWLFAEIDHDDDLGIASSTARHPCRLSPVIVPRF